MDAEALRAQFPVFTDVAFLNAGTCGPVARASAQAQIDAIESFAREGRSGNYYERALEVQPILRASYASLLHADPADVAITSCTSEGLVRVLQGIGLRAGDEVLTAEGEYPALLSLLGALRRDVGITVRTVPLAELADAVRPSTTLVACSHVHWQTGALAPALPDGPAVLLDGAQSVGAVPIDVRELRCDFYVGPGQKWLCGPLGTGLMWVSPAWRDRLAAPSPTYGNLARSTDGLDAELWPDARRHDAPSLTAEAWLGAQAAFDVLDGAGWDGVYARSAGLAAVLAERLAAAGRTVAPRDRTTLVSFEDADPIVTRDRLAAAGVVVRDLPGTPLIRASVGAWNSEDDLDRLLALL
jgi:L-cysteine/cystine lyase